MKSPARSLNEVRIAMELTRLVPMWTLAHDVVCLAEMSQHPEALHWQDQPFRFPAPRLQRREEAVDRMQLLWQVPAGIQAACRTPVKQPAAVRPRALKRRVGESPFRPEQEVKQPTPDRD